MLACCQNYHIIKALASELYLTFELKLKIIKHNVISQPQVSPME